MAAAPSSIYAALYSDEFQLAQSSGKVVWRVNPESRAPRHVCQCRRVAGGDCGISQSVERSAASLCVDGNGHENHGESGAGATNTGGNQAGVVSEKKAQNAEILCLAISGTLH